MFLSRPFAFQVINNQKTGVFDSGDLTFQLGNRMSTRVLIDKEGARQMIDRLLSEFIRLVSFSLYLSTCSLRDVFALAGASGFLLFCRVVLRLLFAA